MSEPRSASRKAEARGRESAALYARLIAALAFARGVLRLTFASREEAVQARARIVALMEPLLELASAEAVLLDVVVDAYGGAVAALDAATLSLKPLVRVETGESLPVCLVAWHLYADTERAEELTQLNGDRTPEFMPPRMIGMEPERK